MIDLSLLHDMYYAAPELWYGIGAVFGILSATTFGIMIWLLKTKQKAYFLRRDRERYAETLYASHDGYFAFIYPDEKVNDPRKNTVERCSRRLAVILGLEKGVKSEFGDVLKQFYKDDERKICKYVELLKEEGVAFEDYFLLKTANKYIRLEGVRICAADGNIYCDMIWFRDISFATNKIKSLEKEKAEIEEKCLLQQDLLDNLPFAVWLRDCNLNITYCNKKFVDFVPNKTKDEIIKQHIEITGSAGESISRKLAEATQKTRRQSKTTTSLVFKGNRIAMEAWENPFYGEQNLEKTYSAGCLVDISELDTLRRNLKRHQNAHLDILGVLGTAFAVFNQDMILQFYNSAFAELWQLNNEWLTNKPSYFAFLDQIRETRLLPEVPDYKAFRTEEQKRFNHIIEPITDLMHLPNGKTLRRVRSPYPMGGVVFAFEDISDRLAATSAYNALMSVQNEILTNLFDGILIFGINGRLSFFNEAYIKLWDADRDFLQGEPTFEEVLDSQRDFFAKDENWEDLKKAIGANILDMTAKKIIIRRGKNGNVCLGVANLSDASLLMVYKNIGQGTDV